MIAAGFYLPKSAGFSLPFTIVEECEEILRKIISGDTDKLYKKLSTISGKCNHWLSDPDDMIELYTNACHVLYHSDVYIPIGCINSYLSIFTKRFNPLHAVQLLDMTEVYLKSKFPKDYERPDYSSEIGSFKKLCAEIRGKVAELTSVQNEHNFEFVLTDDSVIDTILNWCQNKYNNNEAVKEVLAELNCVYGVQNEELFLTSNNDAADSLNNQSWDRYKYIAVLLKDKEVIDFRCKREDGSGKFIIDYRSSNNLPEMVLDAVTYFRNKVERDRFFEDYTNQNNGESLRSKKTEAHKKLIDKLGSSFQELFNRIGDNPLADSLKGFVEMCEAKAPEYGYDNIEVYEPVTAEQIEQWECENGIRLPESYRHFLKFANGFYITNCSEHISGLDGIVVSNEYIEPDYMIIGSIIGDGTTLCLSKSTGEAYVEDHGRYRCFGDFQKLFDYVIDFLYG